MSDALRELPEWLIQLGKTRGFVDHQEIFDHLRLAGAPMSVDALEAAVVALNDMGVAVYEEAPEPATIGMIDCVDAGPGVTMAELGTGPGADSSVKCKFSFVCDKRWDELKETADTGVRFCDGCRKNVHLCYFPEDAAEAIREKRCVALMFAHTLES